VIYVVGDYIRQMVPAKTIRSWYQSYAFVEIAVLVALIATIATITTIAMIATIGLLNLLLLR
jgi:UPF0716 family protein affecting phage T7 exclusion